MAKEYRFLKGKIYVVVLDSEIKVASEERDDCEAFIQELREDDIRFIEERYDLDRTECPDTVECMASREGAASRCKTYTLKDDDFDDEGEYCKNIDDLEGLTADELMDMVE